MGRYIQEIVNFISDQDKGLELSKGNTLLIISTEKNLENSFNDKCDNILSFPTEIFFKESEQITDGSIDYVVIDFAFNEFDAESMRKILRAKLKNEYSDVIIIEDKVPINSEKIGTLFAGSWYQKKEFLGENSADKLTIYYNPPGFNAEEMKSKEITEFIRACESYCEVIENYKDYSVKDFLYNIQKCLVNYYSKGFDLPDSNGSDGNTEISTEYTKKNVDDFFKLSNESLNFLGEHNLYWSNFNPYPDDNDKETNEHSLANDLAEIYEDIKLNTEAF